MTPEINEAADTSIIRRAGFARRTAGSIIDSTLIVSTGMILGIVYFMYMIGPLLAAHGTEAGLNGGIAAGNSIGEKLAGGLMLGILGGIFGSMIAGIISVLLGFLTTGTIALLTEAITGRSVGKLLLGMRIVRSDGTRADLKHRLLRALCKNSWAVLCATGLCTGTAPVFAAGLVSGIVTGVGCFLVLGHDRLALHDHICGTAIVRKTPARNKA